MVLEAIFAAAAMASLVDRTDLAAAGLPQNIIVAGELVDVVGELLETSPTFRDQCRRLERMPFVRVWLVSDRPATASRFHRAQSIMHRYQFGAVNATLHLWSGENTAELIAHELEHVFEFVEGLNYRLQSTRWGSGIWMAPGGHFETARAIDAGHRAAYEAAHSTRAARSPRLPDGRSPRLPDGRSGQAGQAGQVGRAAGPR